MSQTPNLSPKFVPAGAGESRGAPGGGRSVMKLLASESGTIQVSEFEAIPGSGPPLHVHSHEDEAFFILEGEITFFVSEPGDRTGKTGKRVVAPAGALVFGARNSAHTFKNCSNKTAKMVLIVSPGSNFEAFFAQVSAPGAGGAKPTEQEVIARVGKFAPEHGIVILGPNPL